jgi:hypothetical protein
MGALSVTEPDLIRFVHAQAQVYGQVIEELTDGSKRTHWMWLVFPQLTGLGHLARHYAIRDLDQAKTNSALFVSAFAGLLIIPHFGWRWMFVITGVGALIVWY